MLQTHTQKQTHTPRSTAHYFIGLFRVLKRDRRTNKKAPFETFSFVLWGLKMVLQTVQ